jgi:SAM-dependent methyltransferase
MTTDSVSDDEVRQKVREGYTQIAKKGVFSVVEEADDGSCCAPGGGCCGPADFDVEALVEGIGYSKQELDVAPDGANMGLSCGNPTALASLKGGEIVLDLGSGGGFDVFIAGPKVGATGRVIGVDMTPDMISKARKNAVVYSEKTELHNVEFRLGEIEHLPVADNSVDVVISNCVLNLSPNKAQVWKEIGRVLKPGGRVAVSDLALLQPLPQSVLEMVDALVGCVAGAVLISDIERDAKAAGLGNVTIEKKSDYIDTLTSFEDPLYQKILEALPEGSKISEFVTSADVSAVKGGGGCSAVSGCC